ncbi:hypothetical protein TsFJ059_009959 [Trichoderma semiorbis]|uniref:Uncharacterized protein n=1 Tax=Trichoderma semiorbis TaxID=1491008 RepID=A0A9P8HKS2_9HYPO|nr:hypothetical protein TsFJ059_009959 [Trichoderma semiorbis]
MKLWSCKALPETSKQESHADGEINLIPSKVPDDLLYNWNSAECKTRPKLSRLHFAEWLQKIPQISADIWDSVHREYSMSGWTLKCQ